MLDSGLVPTYMNIIKWGQTDLVTSCIFHEYPEISNSRKYSLGRQVEDEVV